MGLTGGRTLGLEFAASVGARVIATITLAEPGDDPLGALETLTLSFNTSADARNKFARVPLDHGTKKKEPRKLCTA